MVNSIKLTKLDRRVLEALGKPWKARMSISGSCMSKIADEIYSDPREEFIDASFMKPSVKSSLSRTLNKLYFNGYVKKCRILRESYWKSPYYTMKNGKKQLQDGGYYDTDVVGLETRWYNEYGSNWKTIRGTEHQIAFPHKTRLFWILTDKGKFEVGDKQ